jgi:hypothetical protein
MWQRKNSSIRSDSTTPASHRPFSTTIRIRTPTPQSPRNHNCSLPLLLLFHLPNPLTHPHPWLRLRLRQRRWQGHLKLRPRWRTGLRIRNLLNRILPQFPRSPRIWPPKKCTRNPHCSTARTFLLRAQRAHCCRTIWCCSFFRAFRSRSCRRRRRRRCFGYLIRAFYLADLTAVAGPLADFPPRHYLVFARCDRAEACFVAIEGVLFRRRFSCRSRVWVFGICSFSFLSPSFLIFSSRPVPSRHVHFDSCLAMCEGEGGLVVWVYVHRYACMPTCWIIAAKTGETILGCGGCRGMELGAGRNFGSGCRHVTRLELYWPPGSLSSS